MDNIQKIGRPPLHGQSHTPEYHAWKAIKRRCNSPTSVPYKWYGARGIKLYGPWNESFEMFFAYVGPRPSNKHSIDRIKNNGNYEPGNVIWRTSKEQCNNRRGNKMITYKGETMSMSQWCDKLKLNYWMVSKRVSKYKWSIERAFTEPAQIHIFK